MMCIAAETRGPSFTVVSTLQIQHNKTTHGQRNAWLRPWICKGNFPKIGNLQAEAIVQLLPDYKAQKNSSLKINGPWMGTWIRFPALGHLYFRFLCHVSTYLGEEMPAGTCPHMLLVCLLSCNGKRETEMQWTEQVRKAHLGQSDRNSQGFCMREICQIKPLVFPKAIQP